MKKSILFSAFFLFCVCAVFAQCTVSITTSTNVACHGDSTGAATAMASGGTAPYSYHWNTNDTTQTITNIPAGTYSVTVTDALLCSDTATITITQPQPLIVTITSSSSYCGGSTGTAVATVSGGTPPYTYHWNTCPVQTTAYANNLGAGSYTVTVTDANGCNVSVTVIVSAAPPLQATITNVTPSCQPEATGSACVTVSGGSAPYAFQWSNGSTTSCCYGLPAGSYAVTVTDANACVVTAVVMIPYSPQIYLSTDSIPPLCNGVCNGSITLNASGGVPPFQYSINGGASYQANNVFTNLCSGQYIAIARDAVCTKSENINLGNTIPVTASVNYTSTKCYACNGAAMASLTNGTPPFTYHWSNGESTITTDSLCVGQHSVTITDALGCTDHTSFQMIDTSLHISCNINNHFCEGYSTVTAQPSGGTQPYTFLWSNDSVNATMNVHAGYYYLTITDDSACNFFDTVHITVPTPVNINISSHHDVNCMGGNNGYAYASVSGGTQPYTYIWNTTPAQTTYYASNLTAGTYTVTITDANNCTDTACVTITQPSVPFSASITNYVNSTGCNNGSATVTATSGFSNYSYHWSNGSNTNNSASNVNTATNLSAGSYTVTVTNQGGCSVTATAIITGPTPLTASASVVTAISCYGDHNGSVKVTVQTGAPNYCYHWSNGSITDSSSVAQNTISNLPAGTYYVTVSNIYCQIVRSVTLTQPYVLNAYSYSVTPACDTACNGIAYLSASGGYSPYTYAWSNSMTGPNHTNLCAGNYTVTVSDFHNCTDTVTLTIASTPHITLNISHTDPACTQTCNGQIIIDATGGTPPLQYSINNGGNYYTSNTFSNLCSGTFPVKVKSGGCIAANTVALNYTTIITPQIISTNPVCGFCSGLANVVAGSGAPPFAYHWSNGENTPETDSLCFGLYSVTVTDSAGCSGQAAAALIDTNIIVSINVTDHVCENYSLISATPSGGISPYTYHWSNDSTGSTMHANAGTYTVTITDHNGCVTIDTAVSTLQAPVIHIALHHNQASCEICDACANVQITGGAAPFIINWSNSQTNDTLNNLCTGGYSVTVTDANSCSIHDSVFIQEHTAFHYYTNITQPKCGLANGQVGFTNVNGQTPPYHYTLNGYTQSSQTFGNLAAGNYTYHITDNNGCDTSGTLTLTNNNYFDAYIWNDYPEICSGMQTTLHAYISGGAQQLSYLWSDNSTASQIMVSPDSTTSYSVTVTSGISCIDSADISVTVLNCTNHITGTVFKDLNGNGIYDSGDLPMQNIILRITPLNYYANTDANGHYSFEVNQGVFNIYIPNPPLYYTFTTPYYQTAIFNENNQTDSLNDFGLQPILSTDVRINMTSFTARPGFDYSTSIWYKNLGNTIVSGSIKYVKDTFCIINSCNPPYSSVNTDTLWWNYSNLNPGETRSLSIFHHLPATVPIGTHLVTYSKILPVDGDVNPNNNYANYLNIVQGSYDPNEKTILPKIVTPDYITELKPLVYTIRFQNTGTDTAFNIIVYDTLCSNVNPASFDFIGSSHPCNWRIYGTGIAEFKFNNILLPDSNTNEPQSHGFVMYGVLPNDSLDIGDTIINFADIYFDYNQPVRTNTVTSVIIDTALFAGFIKYSENNILRVFPNPFTNQAQVQYELKQTSDVSLEVYNILGDKIATLFTGSQTAGTYDYKFTASQAGCKAGMYLVMLTANGKKSFCRVVLE
ncbi:MAG: T9SS type A sorting domain-containing protein [Bacteroidia bacterium]|nr:T9SS type A sorting domain-containing protein [Bacteroidia bacterium]